MRCPCRFLPPCGASEPGGLFWRRSSHCLKWPLVLVAHSLCVARTPHWAPRAVARGPWPYTVLPDCVGLQGLRCAPPPARVPAWVLWALSWTPVSSQWRRQRPGEKDQGQGWGSSGVSGCIALGVSALVKSPTSSLRPCLARSCVCSLARSTPGGSGDLIQHSCIQRVRSGASGAWGRQGSWPGWLLVPLRSPAPASPGHHLHLPALTPWLGGGHQGVGHRRGLSRAPPSLLRVSVTPHPCACPSM